MLLNNNKSHISLTAVSCCAMCRDEAALLWVRCSERVIPPPVSARPSRPAVRSAEPRWQDRQRRQPPRACVQTMLNQHGRRVACLPRGRRARVCKWVRGSPAPHGRAPIWALLAESARAAASRQSLTAGPGWHNGQRIVYLAIKFLVTKSRLRWTRLSGRHAWTNSRSRKAL